MNLGKINTLFPVALMLLLSLGSTGLPAPNGKWSVFGYLSYYNGKYYLTETTRSLYVAGGLRYRTPDWNLSVSIPWVIQNSNLVQQTGNVLYPIGPDDETRSHMDGDGMGMSMGHGGWGRHMNYQAPTAHYISGMGDTYGYFSYRLYGGGPSGYAVYANLQLKAPTASAARGFGTGEWDYGGSFSFQNIFSPHWGAAVELGFLDIGDPDSLMFQNPIFGSLTINYLATNQLSFTAYYLWYTQIQENVEPPRYVNLGMYYRLSDDLTALVVVGRGITRSSAAFNLYTSIEVTL